MKGLVIFLIDETRVSRSFPGLTDRELAGPSPQSYKTPDTPKCSVHNNNCHATHKVAAEGRWWVRLLKMCVRDRREVDGEGGMRFYLIASSKGVTPKKTVWKGGGLRVPTTLRC